MALRNELVGDDPTALFQRWFQDASESEINDPNAAALATASHDGIPNVRMVLIKDVQTEGFSFFTNAGSQKGHELGENPVAALCFHWKSMRRQVRVMGSITSLPGEAVDRYFHSRSRASQIGSSVSHQSHPLASREVLEQEVAQFEQVHAEMEIPRPSYWRGYLLHPSSIEFWVDGPARLHDRRVFKRDGASWTTTLLYP